MQHLNSPSPLFARTIWFGILLLVNTAAYTQASRRYTEDSSKVLATRSEVFELTSSSKSRFTQKLPVKSIYIYDNRLDTSYLCLVRRSFGIWSVNKVGSRKMQSKNGLSHDFSSFLQQHFSAQVSDTAEGKLHCFVKRLRLFDTDPTTDTTLKQGRMFLKLQVELECYYSHQNKYYPAIRIDSMLSLALWSKKEVNVVNTALDSLAAALSKKLNNLQFDKVLRRHVYDYDSLQRRYSNPEQAFLPLKLKSFKPGIYGSFEEWKNNKPYYTDSFSVTRFNNMPVAIYDAKGHLMNASKIFGISDGVRFWIQSMDELYPLIRVGNSYEFYGIAMLQTGGGSPYDNPQYNVPVYIPDATTAGLASGMAGGLITAGVIGLLPASNYKCAHGIDLHTGMIY